MASVRLTVLASVLVLLLGAAPPMAGPRGGSHHLARPTDPGAEDAFTAPADQRYHVDTAHFRIHWTDAGADAATTEFVKDVMAVVEEVWTAEVDQLGWPAPPADAGLGGNDLADVYLLDLDDGPYGYVTVDEANACDICRELHGFLVLENDYVGYDPDPASALRSTVAHEFAHLVQLGMVADAEPWGYEATAVWLERVVYPDADARTVYLADFALLPELSLTNFDAEDGGFDRSYGAYVWNLFLADRYGDDVIRQAWLAAADGDGHLLGAYAEVLADRGSSLDEEFVAFMAATAGWEVGGFPGEPGDYPTVWREAPMSSGDVAQVDIDHAAAHVVDLDVGDTVTAVVRAPRHVAGGVALVATGGGRVLSAVDATLFDGSATVTLEGLGDAGRVSLVVVNADAVLTDRKIPGDQYAGYLHDGVPMVIGVDADPGSPRKE